MPLGIDKLDPYRNTGLDFGNKLNEVIDGLWSVTAVDNAPPTSPYNHNVLYPSPYLIREIQAAGGARHFREYNDLPDGGVKGLTAGTVSEYALTFNCYFATYTFSADTTLGSSTLVVASTTALEVGDSVVASGIQANATISSIGTTTVVLSSTATATASAVPVTGKTWRKDSTAAGHYSSIKRFTEVYTEEFWYSASVGTTPITFGIKSSINLNTGSINYYGAVATNSTSNNIRTLGSTSHIYTAGSASHIYTTTSGSYLKHRTSNIIGLGTPYLVQATEIVTIAPYRQHLVWGGTFEVTNGGLLDIETNGVLIFL